MTTLTLGAFSGIATPTVAQNDNNCKRTLVRELQVMTTVTKESGAWQV